MTLVLKENNLWDIIKDVVPPLIYPQQLATYKKTGIKCQADDLGCCEGSPNSSHIWEDNDKGDVQLPSKPLLEWEH